MAKSNTKSIKKKHPGGRPTKKSEEVVLKLESIFKRGANVDEACSYACISRETYYRWLREDKSFMTKMQAAQYYPVIVAKNVLLDDVIKYKNVDSAKWYLERRARAEFSTRSEHTGADGQAISFTIKADGYRNTKHVNHDATPSGGDKRSDEVQSLDMAQTGKENNNINK